MAENNSNASPELDSARRELLDLEERISVFDVRLQKRDMLIHDHEHLNRLEQAHCEELLREQRELMNKIAELNEQISNSYNKQAHLSTLMVQDQIRRSNILSERGNLNSQHARLLREINGEGPKEKTFFMYDVCCACKEEKPTIFNLPCGHVCMCKECNTKNVGKNKCAICRKAIENFYVINRS